mmetsp:Transcript_7941/g.16935  ORF Transcript_7941/g.16935 Transcript_7941/m.16935 type:complete len:162 (-) Transcript_7941:157-642(-)
MSLGSDDHRLCHCCKMFLPHAMFKPGGRRTLCRMHFNERIRKIKLHIWNEVPQERQAKNIWMAAYADSSKVFKLKISITPAVVLDLLQQLQIPINESVRLLPVDPHLPLSAQNFCLTTPTNRKDMCVAWKRMQDKQSYSMFLDPLTNRKIYATSNQSMKTS